MISARPAALQPVEGALSPLDARKAMRTKLITQRVRIVQVKSYSEAVRLANAAGIDASKKRMRKAGRKVMSLDDYNHGVEVTENFLMALGFDIRSWIALAGVPRNEPDEPKAAKKPKRRSVALGLTPEQQPGKTEPVQLNFSFA